jgi:hypothetical protein
MNIGAIPSHMLDEGFWAEIKVGSEHLRLFSENNAQGVQASVFDVKGKRWLVPSETVDTIEDGKDKTIEYAKAHLKRCGLELPTPVWKKSRSA